MQQDKYTSPDLARSALLIIDVQRDFSDPGAVAEIPGTHDRIPAMQRVLDSYRKHCLPIVHVVRLYLPNGSNADLCRREVIEQGKSIVTPGSDGAELAPSLKPVPNIRLDADTLLSGHLQPLSTNEWAMYKPRWDAFYQTTLEDHLRSLGINTVVLVGCNFPNCPRTTAYSATMRDLRVVLIADAVSGTYDRGLEELSRIGVAIPSTEDFLSRMETSISEAPNLRK